MKGTLFALYMEDDVEEFEVVAHLAEINAIPGCQLVPMVPADMNDSVSE